MISLDLATAVTQPGWGTQVVGTSVVASGTLTYHRFIMPLPMLTSNTAYRFEIDVTLAGAAPHIRAYTQQAATVESYNVSWWYTLAEYYDLTAGTSTHVVEMGPGVEQWNAALNATPPEPYIMWDVKSSAATFAVTAIRYEAVAPAPPPPVHYGAWRQDPDYLQWYTLNEYSGNDPTDGLPVFGYGLSGVALETPFQNPVYPITVQDLRDARDAVNPIGPEGIGGDHSASLWSTTYGWSYSLSYPNWASIWAASTARRWCRVTPRSYSYSPLNYGYSDPLAIGIDYQVQPYNRDSPWTWGPGVTLTRAISQQTTELRGSFRDESVSPVAVPGGQTQIFVKPLGASEPAVIGTLGPPATANELASPQARTLAASIDLTPYISGTNWAGTIWTRQEEFTAPGTPPDPYSTGGVYYGWGFNNLRIDSMVRPPLYRWVYAGAAVPAIVGRPDLVRRRFNA